jgi:hypothetical protein
MRRSRLTEHIGKITFLGVIGTLMGFAIMTFCLSIFDGWLFNSLSGWDILIVCSVLCSTDSSTSSITV